MIHPYAYYLGRAARWYPERIAVIEGDRRLTYRELDRRVTALARALGRLGVRPGDRIAVLQANNHEFMEALAGAARAGGRKSTRLNSPHRSLSYAPFFFQ